MTEWGRCEKFSPFMNIFKNTPCIPALRNSIRLITMNEEKEKK